MAIASSAEAVAVVPSDETNFSKITRGIYVGVTGDVVAIVGGEAITFTAMAAGVIHPIRCTRINETSTTATNMVAVF